MIHSRKKVIVVGSSNPVFVIDTADVFTSLGWDVEIAFRTTIFKEEDYQGYKTIHSINHESKYFRLFLSVINRVLSFFEKTALFLSKRKTTRLATSNLIQSWSVASYINKADPQVVFVHSASDFVMINSFLNKHIKTINMPWGADIYEYVKENNFINKIVRKGLNKFDIVAPVSVNASQYIEDTFKVPHENMYANKYLITGHTEITELINSSPSKTDIKIKLGVPIDSMVCINIRRTKPKWGSKEFLMTAIQLLKENDKLFFIVITGDLGPVASKEYNYYQKEIAENNLADKFLIINRMMTFKDYLELLYVSDLGLSLMHSGDMRSSSIMAAFAIGLPIILSKQNEYFELEKEGFKFQMIDYSDVNSIVKACNKYINDVEFTKQHIENNEQLIINSYYHERGVFEMLQMLDLSN